MKDESQQKDVLIESKIPLVTETNDSSLESNLSINLNEEEELSLDSSTRLNEIETKRRTRLFYLISAGNATGQIFLFNFFSAFAVIVGVTSSMLGFITSIRNLMGSLFQGVIGRFSDKYGRRYILLLGFSLMFSSAVIIMFINNPTMLIIISVVQATSLSIIVPVWNATLGDVTEIKDRASYIGRLSGIGTFLSVSLMLVLATLFYLLDDVFTDWVVLGWHVVIPERTQYIVIFGLAAFNFLICIFGTLLLRETRVSKEKKEQPKMYLALKNKDFRKFFIVNSIFGLMMALLWPLLPIAQVTILGMDFPKIAIINVVFSSCSSLAQYFGGRLGDRIGRRPLIIFGRIAMFVIPLVVIGAILIDNWLLLLVSNVIGGIGIGAVTVSQNAYILDLAPDDQMGAYSGLTQVGWGITTFVGSLSAGFIGDAMEASIGTKQTIIITFSVITVLRFLASLAYFFIPETLPKEVRLLSSTKKEGKIKKKYSYQISADDYSIETK